MNNRLQYLDALRGLAIFCVVFLHYVGFCMNFHITTNIQLILSSFFIPLFFFISGFIGFKKEFDSKSFFECVWRKLIALLMPTVVFYLLASRFFGFSPVDALTSGTKGGYWFGLVLFELFLYYYIVKLVASFVAQRYRMAFMVIMTGLIFIFCYRHCRSYVMQLLSMESLVYSGFICFFAGVFAGKYKEKFLALQKNRFYLWCIVLVIFIDWQIYPIHWTVRMISTTLLVFALFYNNSEWFDKERNINKLLPLLGRYSLAIYFIHYWLLFPLPDCVSDYVTAIQTTDCYAGSGSSSFVVLLIGGAISLLISLSCVLLKHLLSFIPYMNTLLFGDRR